MFKEQTVFVLGAGASWHYNYPTGEDLVRLVREKAKNIIETCKDMPWDKMAYFWPELVWGSAGLNANPNQFLYGPGESQWQIMARAWKQIILTLEDFNETLRDVSPVVIDSFLGQNSRFQKVGKFLIASVLLEAEHIYSQGHLGDKNINHNWHRLLTENPDRQVQKTASNLDLRKYKDHWLRFVVHKLAERPSDLLKSNITFITFNYDVSLERSLWAALNHIEVFDKKQIKDFLIPERFIHVYGQIHERFDSSETLFGRLNDEYRKAMEVQVQYRTYEEAKYRSALFDAGSMAARTIHTINDTTLQTDEKNKLKDKQDLAKEKIKNADNIYILGYGFDEKNSEIIGLDYLRTAVGSAGYKTKKVFFTNFRDPNLINKRASMLFLVSLITFYLHAKLPIITLLNEGITSKKAPKTFMKL